MDAVTKVILVMAIFIVFLIALVIVVGLLQRKLDPAGAVTILGGLFSGLMAGLFIKINKGEVK